MLIGGNIWISVSPPAKYGNFYEASKISSQSSTLGLGKAVSIAHPQGHTSVLVLTWDCSTSEVLNSYFPFS